MQLHQLRPSTRRRREKRVGRGGKRGTTSGRGTKGQKARAGAKIRPAIRDVLKKLPKLRGRGKHGFRPFRPKPVVVDLAAIARRFPDGATVNLTALLSRGLIRKMRGNIPAVKVLGSSPIAKRLTFSGIGASEAARARIQAAGGSFARG